MSYLDHPAPLCSEPNCSQLASIIHSGLLYCGKHAMAKWNLEEREASVGNIKRGKELASI